MLACGVKAPNRDDRMPSARSKKWPDPSRSSSLPVGKRASPSTEKLVRSDRLKLIFTRVAMSPMPVAAPCTKRDVESSGLAGVPPKKCCAVVPPNGTICASLVPRSEEHTSELQSQSNLVCRLLLEKKKTINTDRTSSRESSHAHED